MQPTVLVLHANGTNRDKEAAHAFELAGAKTQILHISELRHQKKSMENYQILVIPGGFSYADTLGAGKLFALDLKRFFEEELKQFIASGKPVIGICNGFQVLIKAGILPGNTMDATLTFNQNGRFECRWVTLLPESGHSLWTKNLSEPLYCPVAHGEGRFLLKDPSKIQAFSASGQIALRYAHPNGECANDLYPENPNGSLGGIAGICNEKGNVLGLMPHPEDHILEIQHPLWTRGQKNGLCLALFKNGVNALQ